MDFSLSFRSIVLKPISIPKKKKDRMEKSQLKDHLSKIVFHVVNLLVEKTCMSLKY